MSHSKKTIFYIIVTFLFQIILNEEKIYEISEYFDIIKKMEISEEDSISLINNLEKIMERYVYLDILKNPPQPQGKDDYYNTVDLQKELNEMNTEKRSLYEFYRDLKILISKCQDINLNINLNKEFSPGISLLNSIFISPFSLIIENEEVYAIPINEEYFNVTDNDKKLINIIEQNTKNPIKRINNKNPIDYIQNFNGDFKKLKSPQAQFVFNQHFLQKMKIVDFPFEMEHLTDIKIEYENDNSNIINAYYKVINSNNTESFFKDFVFKKKNQTNENLNEIKWDKEYDNGKLKCRIDIENEVNVIYQNSFYLSNLGLGIEFLIDCFKSFYENDYKIIVIEDFNFGGHVLLSDTFKQYLNLLHPSKNYMSFRYNDEIKNTIGQITSIKEINTCKGRRADYLFDFDYILDDYGTDKFGEKIKHKRTQIFDGSFIDKDIYQKYFRKPHEIIIFTDGLSLSVTSMFIKGIQNNGGAIIVGYGGNPNENSFDSSQSPSAAFTTDYWQDEISQNIEKLQFTLIYTIQETFSRLDYENKINIPLEYQINLIDERVKIFNSYDDSIYQDFIEEAINIFNKYKKRCNPNNKNLLFITEKCKFNNSKIHGGYQCNDDATWSDICAPSFCDYGYYFDKNEKTCIKDICIKN